MLIALVALYFINKRYWKPKRQKNKALKLEEASQSYGNEEEYFDDEDDDDEDDEDEDDEDDGGMRKMKVTLCSIRHWYLQLSTCRETEVQHLPLVQGLLIFCLLPTFLV